MTVADEQKDLPNAYWLTKMHKAPVGCDFIVASKQFSTKPLTKTTSNVFKRINSLVESFHNKVNFILILDIFNITTLVHNSFPLVDFCSFILLYAVHV